MKPGAVQTAIPESFWNHLVSVYLEVEMMRQRITHFAARYPGQTIAQDMLTAIDLTDRRIVGICRALGASEVTLSDKLPTDPDFDPNEEGIISEWVEAPNVTWPKQLWRWLSRP